MNVTVGIAAATIVASAAVGFASPAWADEFSGTFVPNGPGLNSTWTVMPCGPDCARIVRPRALTMPDVTVEAKPSGLPIATTS